MVTKSPTIVPVSLEDFLQNSPNGGIANAIGNNFYGINHRQRPNTVPINKDHYGLTFFVRPQLNLTPDNIRNARIFTPLLTSNNTSIQMIVRCLLDPRLMVGYPSIGYALKCPFVDEHQAFIPILSNHLKSISGWPDIVLPTNTSKEGAYQESHSMVDGTAVNYSAYDIEATFRNSKGDPIMLLFYIWSLYSTLVYEGTLVPYPDFIVENEIDYNTRIYRLVLDPSKKKVQKIGATGISFPTSLPIGGFFDYSSDKPYNDNNSDITIRFKCLGAQYQDDILIFEFNKTVAVFNPSMNANKFTRYIRNNTNKDIYYLHDTMIQIPDTLLDVFNNRGYARINPENYDLEWWINKSDYISKLEALNIFKTKLSNTN